MAWHAKRLPVAAIGRVVVAVAVDVVNVSLALSCNDPSARLTRELVASQREVANRQPSLHTGMHFAPRLPALFRQFVSGRRG
ncbi:hypothetical protein ACU80Y_19655 [Pandoraea sputorum]